MRNKLFVLVAILLAISTATWAYAQESGQASGGANGSVEEITPPQNPGPTQVKQSPKVGGREVLCNQHGQPVGFTEPARPTTAAQDKDWRKFASHQGWLTRREVSALDAQILRKSKAYTDRKVGEALKAANSYTDRKVKAVHQRVDRLNAKVDGLDVETDKLHNSMWGYEDEAGKHMGVIDALNEHTKMLNGKDGLIDRAKNFKWGLALLKIAILALAIGLVVLLFLYKRISRRLRDLESEFYEEEPAAPVPARPAPIEAHLDEAPPTPTGEEDVLAAEADPTRI